MSGPRVWPVVDEGLGNSTYVVDVGDGRALVVDPTLDLREVSAVARRHGLRPAFAADTHLHADFVTGSTRLAARDGAQMLASAAGGRSYPHRALRDGDEIDLGGLWLQVIATPGHTDEHVAFLLLDDRRPLGVFTGGSLLVGSVARTDLVDPGRTEELARAQYAAVQRLVTLPDETAVWPTHGAGSFCSAPPGMDRTSSVGREKTTNPLLGAKDEDEFVSRLLGGLGSYPPYFQRLAEVNRRGPTPVTESAVLPVLDAAEVDALVSAGGMVVDVRPVEDFAAAHVPGSVSIVLRPAFATWLGWLAPLDRPLVVLRNDDQDAEEIVWQAAKVGYDNLAGELAGGIEAWAAAGGQTASTRLVGPEQIRDQAVLDIRQRAEFAAGHLPGATNVELGDVTTRAEMLPDVPTVVMCGHGERAMSAASLLESAGHQHAAVLLGGPQDWEAASCGTLLTADATTPHLSGHQQGKETLTS
jgi:hydroxyacylglutathione hydrolase